MKFCSSAELPPNRSAGVPCVSTLGFRVAPPIHHFCCLGARPNWRPGCFSAGPSLIPQRDRPRSGKYLHWKWVTTSCTRRAFHMDTLRLLAIIRHKLSYLSIISIHPSIHSPTHRSIYLIYLSIYPFQSYYPSIYLSTYLSIYLCIYLPIYLSI